MTPEVPIPGTYLFDGNAAMKGYALNKMCYSFNSAENAQVQRPLAYYGKFGLNDAQRTAILEKNVLAMIHAGGNIYYSGEIRLSISHLNPQDVGAQQTGRTVEEFKQFIKSQGE